MHPRRFFGFSLLAVSACGGSEVPRLVVGAKNFTEQVVLGEILAQHLERSLGARVDRKWNLGGTFVCHHALVAGQIDLYVEYTGTALTAILKESPSRTPREALDLVRERYDREWELDWTEPLGFENTFAMVVRGGDARRLELRTLTDAVPHARGWRLGCGYEFGEREDGLRGLVATYGLEFGEPPRLMDLGLLYRALAERSVDLVSGNSTDGQIVALDLVVLEDDRRYFPPYDAVPVVRRATLERVPGLREALSALGGAISAERMRAMNLAVSGEHRAESDVAREFLESAPPSTTPR